MKLHLNRNKVHTNNILKALKVTGGFCPCQIIKNEQSLCKFSEGYLPETIDVSELCKNGIKEENCHCSLYLLGDVND